MKAFKNRLEEMAEYEDSGDEPKKCKSVTVII